MTDAIRERLLESADVKRAAAETMADDIATLAAWVRAAFRAGNKLILFGNGGSLCDAIHIAEEMVGRYHADRRSLPAIALSDPGTLTCIANDYGYEAVFRRQVEAWARPGDIVIGLSTSGRSSNVLAALNAAKQQGARTVAFTGTRGREPMAGLADLVLAVPSENTARIQECHITIGHILCEMVDEEFAEE